jgi:hypothetical protein
MQNMKKMRLLSIMQLTESNSGKTSEQLTEELRKMRKTRWSFIIEVLKTKWVRARIDQCTIKSLYFKYNASHIRKNLMATIE